MVGRSPLPCDANCLNAQKNGSARAAASRAAADLVAEPPQLLPTRDPEEPKFDCGNQRTGHPRCAQLIAKTWNFSPARRRTQHAIVAVSPSHAFTTGFR